MVGTLVSGEPLSTRSADSYASIKTTANTAMSLSIAVSLCVFLSKIVDNHPSEFPSVLAVTCVAILVAAAQFVIGGILAGTNFTKSITDYEIELKKFPKEKKLLLSQLQDALSNYSISGQQTAENARHLIKALRAAAPAFPHIIRFQYFANAIESELNTHSRDVNAGQLPASLLSDLRDIAMRGTSVNGGVYYLAKALEILPPVNGANAIAAFNQAWQNPQAGAPVVPLAQNVDYIRGWAKTLNVILTTLSAILSALLLYLSAKGFNSGGSSNPITRPPTTTAPPATTKLAAF